MALAGMFLGLIAVAALSVHLLSLLAQHPPLVP
jgi:hypothetical protein